MSSPYLGQIVAFGGNFAPRGWALCQGQLLNISQNTALFSLLGVTYGGNGTSTFGLPDLRGRSIVGAGQGAGLGNYSPGQEAGVESVTLTTAQLPAHTHAAVAQPGRATSATPTGNLLAVTVTTATPPGPDRFVRPGERGSRRGHGRDDRHDRKQPVDPDAISLHVHQLHHRLAGHLSLAKLACGRHEPTRQGGSTAVVSSAAWSVKQGDRTMAEPFLGEIFAFAGSFAPANYLFCQGQLLPISQYSALFAIMGTTYGGDGQQTFAFPIFEGD